MGQSRDLLRARTNLLKKIQTRTESFPFVSIFVSAISSIGCEFSVLGNGCNRDVKKTYRKGGGTELEVLLRGKYRVQNKVEAAVDEGGWCR